MRVRVEFEGTMVQHNLRNGYQVVDVEGKRFTVLAKWCTETLPEEPVVNGYYKFSFEDGSPFIIRYRDFNGFWYSVGESCAKIWEQLMEEMPDLQSVERID